MHKNCCNKGENKVKEYAINEDFRDYVDKYARDHSISVTEALTHKLVQEAEDYYKERRYAKS